MNANGLKAVMCTLALLSCASLACSCRSRTPDTVERPPDAPVEESRPEPSKQLDAVPISSISLDAVGIQTTSRDETTVEWSTEAFSERAATQLKSIERFLTTVADEDSSQQDLVAPEYRGSSLILVAPRKVVDEPGLVIERSASGNGQHFDGVDGFWQTLRELKANFAKYSNRYAKFKVTSVDASSLPAVRTTVEFAISGIGDINKSLTSRWHCEWLVSNETESLPLLTAIESVDIEQTRARLMFEDRTLDVIGGTAAFQEQLAVGVDYWLRRIEERFGINSAGWQGVAIGDVNGDGRDDLYVCQPGGLPNRMFVQSESGSVRDVSMESNTAWWDHSHSALIVDLDNDGDQDLTVATALGLIFMANDGTGKFSVASVKLCPEAMPFTIAAADYDNDGDLDVYACCYSPRGNAIATRFLARPVPYHDANNGGRNCLYRNEGNLQFTNVTKSVGLDANNRRFSLAAAWEDFDDDGDQDLYVANDYGRNNLYRNDGGTFIDIAKQSGVEDVSAGMSVAWGDCNQDGRMDLYVSNMWSSAGNRIAYQRSFQSGANATTKSEFQRHARGNSLFLNRGDGQFEDVSKFAGVTMGRWAWCSQFVDINNDSREDLLVANGFITQADDTDL
ncbi:MAG: VCBS repeat-containing protein [Planctomycetales bacterium]|nr:VCBS repeat-containing protein [Planctomycetales bacterium]